MTCSASVFAVDLKEIIKRRGMNQQELAKQLGIGYPALLAMGNNLVSPTPNLFARIDLLLSLTKTEKAALMKNMPAFTTEQAAAMVKEDLQQLNQLRDLLERE